MIDSVYLFETDSKEYANRHGSHDTLYAQMEAAEKARHADRLAEENPAEEPKI